jgi:drug/metabolite transporter (DMT)-like permease
LFSQKAKAVFFTLLAGALWGTSFPIIKIGLTYTDPFAFVFWRFLVSTITLLFVMVFLRKLDFKTVKSADKKLLVFLGIANAAGYLLQYAAMGYTTAAKAALFINLSAMWVAILSPRLLGETFTLKKILGVFIGLVGIVFVSTNLDFSTLSGGQVLADLTLIISGVTWAIFMIYNKKLISNSKSANSTSATFQSMTLVLVFTFLAIAPFSLLAGSQLLNLSGWAWLGVFWTAIVCWVIPYYLWLEGLKHLSATTSTVLLLSEIVMAVALSIVVLKEPVTVFSSIGAFLIVIAIALVSVQDKKATISTPNGSFSNA